jgi:hypothetical protein
MRRRDAEVHHVHLRTAIATLDWDDDDAEDIVRVRRPLRARRPRPRAPIMSSSRQAAVPAAFYEDL